MRDIYIVYISNNSNEDSLLSFEESLRVCSHYQKSYMIKMRVGLANIEVSKARSVCFNAKLSIFYSIFR